VVQLPALLFRTLLSDYIEGITPPTAPFEFEVHRPLYDWILEALALPRPLPHQYEFAKLIPGYTLVSKRRLIQLVNENVVSGWDDPRMPTISGIRRRGIPASALRAFVIGVGVTKFNSVTDYAVFEHAVRDDLNAKALRRLAVLDPIKLVLTNIPPARPSTSTRPTTRRARRPPPQGAVHPRGLHRARGFRRVFRRRSISASSPRGESA
jgi:glutaminyl-tRNA synthetase